MQPPTNMLTSLLAVAVVGAAGAPTSGSSVARYDGYQVVRCHAKPSAVDVLEQIGHSNHLDWWSPPVRAQLCLHESHVCVHGMDKHAKRCMALAQLPETPC